MFFNEFEPGDWMSLLTGIGTLALAIVAVIQMAQSRRQIQLGKQQADAADAQAEIARGQAESSRRATETAVEVQRESVRARVDQHAPHIIAYFDEPGPPRVDSSRSGMPGHDGLRLLDPKSIQRSWRADGHEFILPQDGKTFLWFTGSGTLFNEGETSAKIRVSGESRLFGGFDKQSSSPITESTLSPGESIAFKWAAGKTIDQWVNGYNSYPSRSPDQSIWLWITVFDWREFGVVDTLTAHFKPSAVEPVPGRGDHWRVRDAGTYGHVHPLRTRRGYTHEGAMHEDLQDMYDYFSGG